MKQAARNIAIKAIKPMKIYIILVKSDAIKAVNHDLVLYTSRNAAVRYTHELIARTYSNVPIGIEKISVMIKINVINNSRNAI